MLCSEDSRYPEEEGIRFRVEKTEKSIYLFLLNKSENHKRTHKSVELFILNFNAHCIFKGRFIVMLFSFLPSLTVVICQCLIPTYSCLLLSHHLPCSKCYSPNNINKFTLAYLNIISIACFLMRSPTLKKIIIHVEDCKSTMMGKTH